MYKSDDDIEHKFIKLHGDYVINKWLSYHENKSFKIKSITGFGADNNVLKLFYDTIDYLGYDLLRMNDVVYCHFDELHCQLYSRNNFRLSMEYHIYSDKNLDIKREEIDIEKESHLITPELYYMIEYDLRHMFLRDRKTGDYLPITQSIYPLDLESEVLLARTFGDYLHSNKGIKVASYVHAHGKGVGLVIAEFEVKLPNNFIKYHNFASVKPIVEKSYHHHLNGMRYNSNREEPVKRPIRYSDSGYYVSDTDNKEYVSKTEMLYAIVFMLFVCIVASLFFYGGLNK